MATKAVPALRHLLWRSVSRSRTSALSKELPSWRGSAQDCPGRPFTTTTRRFEVAMEERTVKPSERTPSLNVRIVPASPSYFTAQPLSTDDYLYFESLQRKYELLPTVPPGTTAPARWTSLKQYRLQVGESVRPAKHRRVMRLLQRMNRIHPSVMPPEVKQAIALHKEVIDSNLNRRKPRTLDQHGRAVAVGRRKSSTAQVWLVEGEGDVLINGKCVTEVFGRIHDRESALWALRATGRLHRYNVWALVQGGGTTGQAEALTLGVARALLVHEPKLKPTLRRAGCMTRDSRAVERKKPGKLKARKMPAWVKR